MEEPTRKRTVSFFDGQNLFRHAKDAFHHHPNYDPVGLTKAVCAASGWGTVGVHFYAGVPDTARSSMLPDYWARRLTVMRRAGIIVITRKLHHRNEQIRLPDGTTHERSAQRIEINAVHRHAAEFTRCL